MSGMNDNAKNTTEQTVFRTVSWISSSFSAVRNLAFYTLGTASFLLKINALVFLTIILIGALVSCGCFKYKQSHYDKDLIQLKHEEEKQAPVTQRAALHKADISWVQQQQKVTPDTKLLLATHFVFNIIIFFQLITLSLHQLQALGFLISESAYIAAPFISLPLAIYMTYFLNKRELDAYAIDNQRLMNYIFRHSRVQTNKKLAIKSSKAYRTKVLLVMLGGLSYSAAQGQWFIPIIQSHPILVSAAIGLSIFIPIFQATKDPEIRAFCYSIAIAISSHYSYLFCFTSLIHYYFDIPSVLTSLHIAEFSVSWVLSVVLSIAFGIAFYKNYLQNDKLYNIYYEVKNQLHATPEEIGGDTMSLTALTTEDHKGIIKKEKSKEIMEHERRCTKKACE